MDFGEYLRTKRTAKGLTIRQLAAHAGCAESYLSLLERGERGKRGPNPTILRRLAVPLSVPYEVLMIAAGYPYDETGDSSYPITIIKLLRESLGDTREEFSARIGVHVNEVEVLESQKISDGTLRWIFHRLFSAQRMLSPIQKTLLRKAEAAFREQSSEQSRRLERLLRAFLDIDDDIRVE